MSEEELQGEFKRIVLRIRREHRTCADGAEMTRRLAAYVFGAACAAQFEAEAEEGGTPTPAAIAMRLSGEFADAFIRGNTQ